MVQGRQGGGGLSLDTDTYLLQGGHIACSQKMGNGMSERESFEGLVGTVEPPLQEQQNQTPTFILL